MRIFTSVAMAIGLLAPTVTAGQLAPPVRVPTSVLEKYVGEYVYPDGASFKVAVRGETLVQVLPGREIAYTPLSETLFMLGPNFTADFVIDRAGGATQILSNGTSLEFRLRRKGSPPAPPAATAAAVPAVDVPRSVLERYVGVYEYIPGQMNRTDLRIVIRLEGGTLVRDGMGSKATLTPISETTFMVANTSFVAEFVIDEAGVTQIMGTGFQQVLARRIHR
jgi:hypothetical protein